MKKLLIYALVLSFTFSCSTTENGDDKIEILAVMDVQQKAWSNNDIEGFMEGYWKNDSLKFYGNNGVTYGWQKTLDNYKRKYPSKNETGTLNFTIDDISKIDNASYFVMGQYHLTRVVGDANGVFMIIFKKINGEWKIIADLSC